MRKSWHYVKHLKNIRRGRISEYVDQYAHAVYTPTPPEQTANPLWQHRAQCIFPCATQNEINKQDAYQLINNNIKLVCEGASMPCTLGARDIFLDKGIPLCTQQSRQCRWCGGLRSGTDPEQHPPELVG
jgi:glutamate dehydrogenase (NADP+)